MKNHLIPFQFVFVLTLSFCSCKKGFKSSDSEPWGKEKISYFSNKLINDSLFQNFIIASSRNSLLQAKLIGSSVNTRLATLDSSQVYDAGAEVLTTIAFLEVGQPDFMQLPIAQRNQVMNAIRDSLSSVSYRSNYPSNPLILYELSTVPHLIEIGELAVLKQQAFAISNISSTEFWSCTVFLGIGTLAEYGSILSDLRWLIQNGNGAWSAVFSLARQLIKNAVPWYKVASLALTYAGCLYTSGLA